MNGRALTARRSVSEGAAVTPSELGIHRNGTMKLSCIPVSFFEAISKKQMTLAEWFDFAVELGLDGVECGPLMVRPLGPANAAQFCQLAENRGPAGRND